jgi:hypothetical protein
MLWHSSPSRPIIREETPAPIGQKAQLAAAGRVLDAAEPITADGRAPAPIGCLYWESVLGF